MPEKLHFNHKYWHCRGVNCDKREDCLFYIAYKEIADNADKYQVNDECNEDMKYTKVIFEK